jgi:hypothetical protein
MGIFLEKLEVPSLFISFTHCVRCAQLQQGYWSYQPASLELDSSDTTILTSAWQRL